MIIALLMDDIPDVHCVHLQISETEHEGVSDVPLKVVNNYFSIGADAQIALEFHNERGM